MSCTKTLHQKCNTDSQPHIPRRQYGELTPSEEIFLDQLLQLQKRYILSCTKIYPGINASIYYYGYGAGEFMPMHGI